MKKVFALLLALAMVFALAACGDSGEAVTSPRWIVESICYQNIKGSIICYIWFKYN